MSPEERAKKLGVKVIPAKAPMKLREIIPMGDSDKFIKSVPIVAVCGGCGCTIRQNERKDPCGREVCPFGFLTM
jgi:hypothetical protein